MTKKDKCPCASGATYGECCEPIISGKKAAKTAADLMRARYSAYAVQDIDFLYKSSGPELQADFNRAATEEWSKKTTWQGLDIERVEKGGEHDDEGIVVFTAHYTANNQECEHHETSYFKRIEGEWRFIDGKIDTGMPYRREEAKVGRNDPCPCGSGKKYKKCCGKGK